MWKFDQIWVILIKKWGKLDIFDIKSGKSVPKTPIYISKHSFSHPKHHFSPQNTHFYIKNTSKTLFLHQNHPFLYEIVPKNAISALKTPQKPLKNPLYTPKHLFLYQNHPFLYQKQPFLYEIRSKNAIFLWKIPIFIPKTPQKRHFRPQKPQKTLKNPSKPPKHLFYIKNIHFCMKSGPKTPIFLSKSPPKHPFLYQKHLKNAISALKTPPKPLKNPQKPPQNCTEEGMKVARNHGAKHAAVFRRIRGPGDWEKTPKKGPKLPKNGPKKTENW
jgi:hypothetical protein